jgi:hypothetical protein
LPFTGLTIERRSRNLTGGLKPLCTPDSHAFSNGFVETSKNSGRVTRLNFSPSDKKLIGSEAVLIAIDHAAFEGPIRNALEASQL